MTDNSKQINMTNRLHRSLEILLSGESANSSGSQWTLSGNDLPAQQQVPKAIPDPCDSEDLCTELSYEPLRTNLRHEF